jgi:serine/threonine protein kinase
MKPRKQSLSFTPRACVMEVSDPILKPVSGRAANRLDVTTANILFCLEDFDRLGEDDIYHLFGRPKTGELETQSGETAGPEAPRYIVEALDFMSSPFNIISHDIKLIDFDQCFPVQSPPKEMLGIPPENLAPEVAVGQPAGPPSDIWALGCCIFRLRSGEGPFENHFDVTSPVDLMRYIVKTLGDMPPEWQDILWDDEGQPTKDPNKGHAFWKSEGAKPLKEMVYKIWDEPEGRAIQTGAVRPNLERGKRGHEEEHEPFPPCFVDMVWKPSAVSIDDVYLYSYNEEYLELLEECPKIQNREAALLYDLMSKIFVYDPKSRLTARELLCHPWFHIEGL